MTTPRHDPRREAARDVVRSTLLRVLRDCNVDHDTRQRIARRLLPELESRSLRPFLAVIAEDA